MVYLTQSLHGYYSAMPGRRGPASGGRLLTNFSYEDVSMPSATLETANWASGLIGKSLQTFTGGSMTPSEGVYRRIDGPEPIQRQFLPAF